MNNTKAALAVSNLIAWIQAILGWFTAVVFGICVFTYTEEDGADAFVIWLIFMIIGIVLIVKSRKRKKLIREFKRYVSVLSNDPSGSIENLASVVGTSQDVVKKNLELMIRRKYFVNASLNQRTNSIMIGSANASGQRPVTQQNEAMQQKSKDIQWLSVTCKCCGGINKVPKGKMVECDFCGSPLQG